MPNLLAANLLAANKLAASSPSSAESDYSGAHLSDTGQCQEEMCARNSPAPVESGGFTAGHFALTVGGQFYTPGVGCDDMLCGGNSPVLDSDYGASHFSLYDLII
jgi:hypothetical protein